MTRLFVVPTMARSILDHPSLRERDLSSLRQVSVGGAPAGPELVAEIEARLGCEVICGYGMTESSPQLTKALDLRSHDARPSRPAAPRRSHHGAAHRRRRRAACSTTTTSKSPGTGRRSGRSASLNHVMTGYWNRPDETASRPAGRVAAHRRPGHGRRPGGLLTIVDRSKDVIVSGGENISSVEVENASSPTRRWPRSPSSASRTRMGRGAARLLTWPRSRTWRRIRTWPSDRAGHARVGA